MAKRLAEMIRADDEPMFPPDEEPTKPTSQAHRAAELVREWAKLDKPKQSLVLSLIKELGKPCLPAPSIYRHLGEPQR